MLAEVRGVPVPSGEALKRLAASLGGFSEAVIDSVCYALEDAPAGEYRRMPTPEEFRTKCQDAAQTQVKKTRWCGRCTYGVIRRSDGEYVECECNCHLCGNSGMVVVRRNGELYDSRIHFKEDKYATRCPRGCAVVSAEAA